MAVIESHIKRLSKMDTKEMILYLLSNGEVSKSFILNSNRSRSRHSVHNINKTLIEMEQQGIIKGRIDKGKTKPALFISLVNSLNDNN